MPAVSHRGGEFASFGITQGRLQNSRWSVFFLKIGLVQRQSIKRASPTRPQGQSRSPFSASLQAPVVQKMDSTIHWINHYPEDKYQENQLRYPLDGDLSDGQRFLPFEQREPDLLFDFSQVLELNTQECGLFFSLRAFRTENQCDGEWSSLFRDQKESTKVTHRFVVFKGCNSKFPIPSPLFLMSSRVVEVLTGL